MKSIEDVRHFINFAANELKIKQIPPITFVGKQKNNDNTFSIFNRKNGQVTVRITDRHPIDISRSICHELMHYKQMISGSRATEKIKEDDANKMAGRIMQKYDTTYPKVFSDKAIKEDYGVAPIPTNNIGTSSSTPSTGSIDTIDPILNNKITKKVNDNKKKLRDILGFELKNKKKS